MATSADTVQSRIAANISTLNTNIDSISASLPLAKAWIDSESAGYAKIPAQDLLSAARLSLLEAAASWSAGLNRAAAGSLRTFLENAISWLYYKDHAVEYRLVTMAKSDLFLPKAVQKYLIAIDGGFEAAYKYLEKSKSRPNEYYYTDISSFVHAHPNFLLSGKTGPEIVVSVPPDQDFIKMCQHADEFLNDQFITFYRHSWGSVPQSAQAAATNRLGDKLADFLAVP